MARSVPSRALADYAQQSDRPPLGSSVALLHVVRSGLKGKLQHFRVSVVGAARIMSLP